MNQDNILILVVFWFTNKGCDLFLSLGKSVLLLLRRLTRLFFWFNWLSVWLIYLCGEIVFGSMAGVEDKKDDTAVQTGDNNNSSELQNEENSEEISQTKNKIKIATKTK